MRKVGANSVNPDMQTGQEIGLEGQYRGVMKFMMPDHQYRKSYAIGYVPHDT
jgi:hypothetical protein